MNKKNTSNKENLIILIIALLLAIPVLLFVPFIEPTYSSGGCTEDFPSSYCSGASLSFEMDDFPSLWSLATGHLPGVLTNTIFILSWVLLIIKLLIPTTIFYFIIKGIYKKIK